VIGALSRDKAGMPEATHPLFDAIEKCIRRGLLDECSVVQREADHYVR
jgi:hypothetical protein